MLFNSYLFVFLSLVLAGLAFAILVGLSILRFGSPSPVVYFLFLTPA